MSAADEPLLALRTRLAELAALEEAMGILGWDQEVCMPPGAAESRGRQVAAIAVLHHGRLCDPALGDLLARAAERVEGLDSIEAANVREARRERERALRVPAELVDRWSRATVAAHGIWVDARARSDFAAFAPILGELVVLAKARARAIDPERAPYEVLLGDFEPGLAAADLDALFDPLERFLVPFLGAIRGRPAPPRPAALDVPVAASEQQAICRELMTVLGFDWARGRLDVGVHPMTGGAGPCDVRVTNRYRDDDLLAAIFGAIHETGHALYEQGRDPAWADQPVSKARSMGWHESQSLLWENQVGRSPEFWGFLLPWLGERLPHLRGLEVDAVCGAIARVDPENPIRVEADEATYPLHVILRYRLERALFAGELAVADLPAAWDEGMRRSLGVTPASDREGVLQDVHWSGGAFGYFPSYTVGAALAAQIYATAKAAVPAIPAALGAGECGPLRAWLTAAVHRQGSRLESRALCLQATGGPLTAGPLCEHLRRRIGGVYGLSDREFGG